MNIGTTVGEGCGSSPVSPYMARMLLRYRERLIASDPVFDSPDAGEGFTKMEGAFLTEAAMVGRKPLLTIRTGVRLGTLQIRAT